MTIKHELYMVIFALALMSMPGIPVLGQDKGTKKEEAVELSGISIIGNQELPKTLFIVPWKNSEAGFETNLTNTLDEGMKPVDREVFLRELDYYDFSHENNSGQ